MNFEHDTCVMLPAYSAWTILICNAMCNSMTEGVRMITQCSATRLLSQQHDSDANNQQNM